MRRVLLVALLCVAPAAARAQPPELDETTEETTAGVETARETTAGVETAGESTTAEETEARLREQAGRLAMQRGELEEARADFARAFALAPTPARGWALADAQGALLETTNQAATLRALIDLDPSHERAPEARARLVVLDASLASAEVETAEVDTTAAPTTDAAPAPAEIATPTETAGEEERDVFDEPWFWAIVAVAAVGLVVTASVLTGDPGVQDPIPGTAGEVDGVVYTLVAW